MKNKGALKKISGTCKYVATAIPALLLAFGIGATVGGVVESVGNTKTIDGFYESAPVQQVIQTELDEIDSKVESGEYTFTQANNKQKEVQSNNHLKEVTDSVYQGNAEYQGAVKTVVRDYALVTSGLLSLSAGIFTGFFWYVVKDNTASRLIESAQDDFAYGKYSYDMDY